jgi:hypothetical protein
VALETIIVEKRWCAKSFHLLKSLGAVGGIVE